MQSQAFERFVPGGWVFLQGDDALFNVDQDLIGFFSQRRQAFGLFFFCIGQVRFALHLLAINQATLVGFLLDLLNGFCIQTRHSRCCS